MVTSSWFKVFRSCAKALPLALAGCEGSPAVSSSAESTACSDSLSTSAPLDFARSASFFESLNFPVKAVKSDKGLLRFQAEQFEFIFCPAERSWRIEANLSAQTAVSSEYYFGQLANPPWQYVIFNSQALRYRVLLEPNPLQSNNNSEAKDVLLEIDAAGEIHRQRLYSAQQMRDASAGISLGVATVSTVKIMPDSLWFSISPEQGEGFGGIATIVQYFPKTQTFEVIQPEPLAQLQINDLALQLDRGAVWLATQRSGEGNPYLPGLGLVRYDLETNKIESFSVRNSPLVGAIPHQLQLAEKTLWVSTGNGICAIEDMDPAETKNWDCWRFQLTSTLTQDTPVFPSLRSQDAIATISAGSEIEVLWVSSTDFETDAQRFEIVYEPGLSASIPEGRISWSDYYGIPDYEPHQSSWQSPMYWPGENWRWLGDRFVRGLDEVDLNLVGGGPVGIYDFDGLNSNPPDYWAFRGDLVINRLSDHKTDLTYFSAWVEAVGPVSLTLVPTDFVDSFAPNPLLKGREGLVK